MAAPPPGGPRYRRYWGYWDRPYRGFGCLYSIIMFVLIWFLLSLIIDILVVW